MNCQNSQLELQNVLSHLDRWVTHPSTVCTECHCTSPLSHPLLSSVSPLSIPWGCVSLYLLLLSCLLFSHHPFIHSSLWLCHCLLIECLYIYYSFDWLPLIASQVAEINHSRNPAICILFGEFWWQRLENLRVFPPMWSFALARGSRLEKV